MVQAGTIDTYIVRMTHIHSNINNKKKCREIMSIIFWYGERLGEEANDFPRWDVI